MNTEDRELLELAAKAAGFGAPHSGATCWTESEYPRGSGKHGALWNYVGYMDTAELFNPLTDDGDAFRLMVAIGIRMYPAVEDGQGALAHAAMASRVFGERNIARTEPGEMGDAAAARRAVTRVAAEIGRSMP
jgi:hypothetical protein